MCDCDVGLSQGGLYRMSVFVRAYYLIPDKRA